MMSLCYEDGTFIYFAGVEITGRWDIPDGLTGMDLPEQKYAVFTYAGHVAEIRDVMSIIWGEALLASGNEAAFGPILERFDSRLDSTTGLGEFEIWIAVR